MIGLDIYETIITKTTCGQRRMAARISDTDVLTNTEGLEVPHCAHGA